MCLGVIMVGNESRNLPTLYPKSFKELKRKKLKYYEIILERYLHTFHLHTSHTSTSRADLMAEFPQGELYY